MSELTYRDVRTVLALLDGWQHGRVRFKDGDLSVDAICTTADTAAPQPDPIVVRSPGVGTFEAAAALALPDSTAPIGWIRTLTRSIAVTAEPGSRAFLCVRDGDFVEYAQPLATIVTDA